MRVGIDARFIGPQGTGLGKYTEKLIQNLAAIDKDNQYVIFLKKDNWDYLELPKNFKKILADVGWYTIKEQIKLPAIYKKQNLDLLHVPHFNVPLFYRGKFVVTIHDLIHHQFSETSATTRNPFIFKGKRLAYRQVINHAILKSKKIITPSKFVKSQIIQQYKVPEDKVTVTYEAAEEEYARISNYEFQISNLLKKYQIKQPFLIYVGNAYPHKNLDNLLEGFKLLLSHHPTIPPSLRLVIVCSRDVFAKRLEEKIKSLGLSEKVILTGYISSSELPAIFKSAEAYVFPTLSEGFGIPGLNAMASGLPVICSQIPVLEEIYGSSALYFDPRDPADIAKKINKYLSTKNHHAKLVQTGLKKSGEYSWKNMAKQTLNIYEAIAKS
jgi:glycosyltransferase involved in cell wall biosynthesis